MTTCRRCFGIFYRHEILVVNKTPYCEPCTVRLREVGLLKENKK